MRRAVVMLVSVLTLTSCLGEPVNVHKGAAPAPSPGVGCSEGPVLGRISFTDPDGRCVPETVLEMVQCDLDQPELIVRWAGTDHERRYLGGPYRVAVRDVPEGAEVIGNAASGHLVFAKPGEPNWVWVQDPMGVSRWLALPQGVPWEGRAPSAFFIGDSITDGAQTYISAALPDWTTGFDAVIGRPSSGGVTPAETQGQTDPPPDAVVVELGTNDQASDAFRQNAIAILDALRAVPVVVWQTAHGPMETIPPIDAAIRDVVTRYPNTVVADWNTYVTDAMLTSDGVHPLSNHEGAMANLQAPILDTWRAAVEGRGATSCLTPTAS
jgi:GDSL-like Lipase/Acylhydrolase family